MNIDQIARYGAYLGASYYAYEYHFTKFMVLTFSYGCYKVYQNIDSIKEIYKEAVFTWEEMTPWRYHRDRNPGLYDEKGYLKKPE